MKPRVLLLLMALTGCYQTHQRGSDAAVDARSVDAIATDAGTVDGGRLCGCPGSPTRQVCVLPLMCCPATETCENPARFNCTGSDPCR